jgi:NADH-quinone oxidoreductase subunit H
MKKKRKLRRHISVTLWLVALIMIWIRGTLPRMRYDQLMALGWKVLIPAALINIVLTGAFILLV